MKQVADVDLAAAMLELARKRRRRRRIDAIGARGPFDANDPPHAVDMFEPDERATLAHDKICRRDHVERLRTAICISNDGGLAPT